MTDLESLIRLSRPQSLEAGPHRDQLARLLLERRVAPCTEAWSLPRYALALATALLCLGLAILLQPRMPDMRLRVEQQELLASLLLAEQHPSSYPVAVTATTMKSSAPPSNRSSMDLRQKLRDDQNTMQEVLADMSVNPGK